MKQLKIKVHRPSNQPGKGHNMYTECGLFIYPDTVMRYDLRSVSCKTCKDVVQRRRMHIEYTGRMVRSAQRIKRKQAKRR